MELLQVQDLNKNFGGLQAVANLSFHVSQGEIVGLIGPNGAGKTTVFNLIAGAIRPDTGQVMLDGLPVKGLRPHQICRMGLTRTYQIVKPFKNISILDNVIVGALNGTDKLAEARDRARGVMEMVGLADKADSKVDSLTIADRKRLELAKGLATGPKLLLLDEVMAGLNNKEIVDIISLMNRIREQGVTLFIIEHVMAAVMSLSDRIIVIHHGQKIAEGPAREVGTDPKVIEAYLGKSYQHACS